MVKVYHGCHTIPWVKSCITATTVIIQPYVWLVSDGIPSVLLLPLRHALRFVSPVAP